MPFRLQAEKAGLHSVAGQGLARKQKRPACSLGLLDFAWREPHSGGCMLERVVKGRQSPASGLYHGTRAGPIGELGGDISQPHQQAFHLHGFQTLGHAGPRCLARPTEFVKVEGVFTPATEASQLKPLATEGPQHFEGQVDALL
eukprot:14538151-Alexandrium_andersonii.AAC.1